MVGGGRGGPAKSDFITKGSLIKHLMRGGGGVKKEQKSSDVIYGRPLKLSLLGRSFTFSFLTKHLGKDFEFKKVSRIKQKCSVCLHSSIAFKFVALFMYK